jgi:hypothetical protein
MSFIPQFDPDQFKPKPPPKVALQMDRDSVVRVIGLFVSGELTDIQSRLAYKPILRDWQRHDYERARERATEQYKFLMAHWGTPQAVDRSLTALHSIRGLERLWGEENPKVPFPISETPYLIAQTVPLIFRDGSYEYDLGNYLIMIPLGGDIKGMHWVPMRDPHTERRHPHHQWVREGYFNTCLGTYHEYVERSLDMGDIVGLTRFMAQYIQTYNPSSPLVHLQTIPHARRRHAP